MSAPLGNTHEADGGDLSIAQQVSARHQSAREVDHLLAQRDRQVLGERRYAQVRSTQTTCC